MDVHELVGVVWKILFETTERQGEKNTLSSSREGVKKAAHRPQGNEEETRRTTII